MSSGVNNLLVTRPVSDCFQKLASNPERTILLRSLDHARCFFLVSHEWTFAKNSKIQQTTVDNNPAGACGIKQVIEWVC